MHVPPREEYRLRGRGVRMVNLGLRRRHASQPAHVVSTNRSVKREESLYIFRVRLDDRSECDRFWDLQVVFHHIHWKQDRIRDKL